MNNPTNVSTGSTSGALWALFYERGKESGGWIWKEFDGMVGDGEYYQKTLYEIFKKTNNNVFF